MKFKAALLALAILLICAVLSACVPDTPLAAADRYLSALRDGNVRVMANCLLPGPAERLRSYVRAFGSEAGGPQLIGIAPGITPPSCDMEEHFTFDYEITDVQAEEDTAWVTVDAVFTADEDSCEQELLLTLERQNGSWRIAGG